MIKHTRKILLTGGGSGGPVTPLLAIADELKKDGAEFLWIGTKSGVEREMVEREDIEFKSISSGKLRRYFSWKNFIDPWKIIYGTIQSFFIIRKFKPDIVMSAGGFVAVPVAYAAYLLKIPILIHQMDVRPGLANKLVAPIAKIITTTFESSLLDYGKKAIWVGNPVRNKLSDFVMTKREAFQKLGLSSDLPVVLVMGGGTGAMGINNYIYNNLEKLTKYCQIIHLTGKGKQAKIVDNPKYHAFQFLDINGMLKVYTVADLVVSRCGMGSLTELSQLAKPAVLIPIPDSHQEDNALVFKEKNAAVVLSEKETSDEEFAKILKELLSNSEKRKNLANNILGVIKNDAINSIKKII